MLQLHCQIISRFNNIMELIEETAETFCQVSADSRNVFPIVDQYLESCTKLHSDLRMVSLSLGNFFQSLEHLSVHIADTKGKFKKLFHFLNKSDCERRTQQSYWREFTSSPPGASACHPGTSVFDQKFSQQNDLSITWPVRTIPEQTEPSGQAPF